MHNTKTSKKRKRLSRNIKKRYQKLPLKPIRIKSHHGIRKFDPKTILADKHFIIDALLECFQENDPEAMIEILDGYISAQNKSQFALRANISRSTLYDMLEGKKNPTLRVFMQCVHELLNS